MFGERGSIILFVLFVCLAVAVLVQTLSVVVLCADHGLSAEDSGRVLMREKDLALAALVRQALFEWGPMPWTVIQRTPEETQGSLAVLPESSGWALVASARHSPDVSPLIVSAWLERGRDGLDLPLAGLVAGSAIWTPGRVSPWLEVEGNEGMVTDAEGVAVGSIAYLQDVPASPLVGAGVAIEALAKAWQLDDGWQNFFESLASQQGNPGSTGTLTTCMEGLSPGERVDIMHGEAGRTLGLPLGWGESANDPGVLVVTGGGSLDARGMGDIYGVVVVDGGAALLQGTRIHGALFVTGSVDFGTSGIVSFCRPILRWATDGSLVRARLVSGTRGESLQ